MSILRELRRRKVFRVAAVYAVVAWGILQVVDVIDDPLALPPWFDTVTIILLAIGFPVALILGWAFDLGPEGISRSNTDGSAEYVGRGKVETGLLFLLMIGMGWLILRDVDIVQSDATSSGASPVVILMDTFAPRGVYDEETRKNSGTNADVLSDVLQELPIITQKETIGSKWDREIQVLNQKPALILIHRSAFFHSMNQELGFGYPESSGQLSEEWRHLYDIAENKLVAFMGYIAQGSPNTKFIVYSRGTGGGWAATEYRDNWLKQVRGRFPALAGKITPIRVPGGVVGGSFQSTEGAGMIRSLVKKLLHLDGNKAPTD